MMSKIKSILVIFIFSLAFSACNYSSSSSTNLVRVDEEFFRSPSDHGGVARYYTRDDSNSYHILTTNMDDPIVDPTQSVNTDALREIDALPLSRRYTGTLTRRRVTGFKDATFHMYTDKDWPRVYALLAVDGDGYTDFEVGGPDVPDYLGGTRPDLPSGTHSYNGTSIITTREGQGYIFTGEFRMEVNFDQSSGTIRAEVINQGDPTRINDDFRSLLDGDFGIDYRNASFHGSRLDFTGTDPENNLSNFRFSASIYGSFHNHRGTGVTGVYFDNSAQPIYGGAIVGARTRY